MNSATGDELRPEFESCFQQAMVRGMKRQCRKPSGKKVPPKPNQYVCESLKESRGEGETEATVTCCSFSNKWEPVDRVIESPLFFRYFLGPLANREGVHCGPGDNWFR
ncbi:hypothetical protein NPIL_360821 [Nephila pilipes]|uniref:Uncharacterized protein n=1 Tax=Nephila pilipes TaxID=299642 RepID=A0A8X6Q3T2_NEPPI|nr:hypothetical protein NPIL_360821 [Nephila pilipes]